MFKLPFIDAIKSAFTKKQQKDNAEVQSKQWYEGTERAVFVKHDGKRISRARATWLNQHGAIPSGWVIYHSDGDVQNDNIANLECISRAELINRNLRRNGKV